MEIKDLNPLNVLKLGAQLGARLRPNPIRPNLDATLAPGAAVYVGPERQHEIELNLYDFTEGELSERKHVSVEEAAATRGTPTVSWIDVSGIHDAELIQELCKRFDVHSLSIEDILNPSHRAKIEYFDDYVYLVLKMIYLEPEGDGRPTYEQVSVILGQDYVLTFQETPKDVFDPVRKRLRNPEARVRRRPADYLAYALMDAIVDNYTAVLEHLATQVEYLEDLPEEVGPQDAAPRLHALKRELMTFRKAVWPLRDAVSALSRAEEAQIHAATLPFLRDLHDHLVQIVESIDIYREMVASLQDLFMTLISNRMNEEMRLLTVVGTIFIPLTFVAGVYGMNFEVMPELKWKYGYAGVWLVMLVVGLLSFRYFRKRSWL